jgi:hypothetical protein
VLTNSVPELVASNGVPFGEPKPPFSTLVMGTIASASLSRFVDVVYVPGGVSVVERTSLTRGESTAMACSVAVSRICVAVVVFNSRNSGKPCLSEGAMRPIKGTPTSSTAACNKLFWVP